MTAGHSFSVIVPVRDDLACLKRTLPRVVEAVEAHGDAELIVVDNGSEDGSWEWLQGEHAGTARILRHPDASISAVRNHGARHAGGDVLCFVDADCVVRPGHLHAASAALEETSAAAVGSRYALPADAGWVETTWHRLHRTGRRGYVEFLSAGNLVVRADVFREVGGFDERLITGEDAELCQRLRRRGHRIFQDPAIEAVHLGNAKTPGGFFRKQRWYSLGMLGTVRRSSIDKPVAATILHVVLVALAVVMALAVPGPVGTKLLVVAGAAVVVPLLSVLYRWIQVGRVVRPVRSLVLYEIFFAARIAAAVLLMAGRGSGWRPAREAGAEDGVAEGRRSSIGARSDDG